MDIVRFKGGLGNQMFQYAFMESLRHRNREVKASLGFYDKHKNKVMPFVLDNIFENVKISVIDEGIFQDIDDRWKNIKKDITKLEQFKGDCSNRFFWVEDKEFEYTEKIYNTKSCTFVGYWQTERYFKEIEENIREAFLFCNIETNLFALGKMLNHDYCSVHIRRGDYLQNDIYSNICTVDYYKKAINYIRNMDCNAKFIFLSNDITWVKKNICIDNAIYCEKEMFDKYQDWYDMYLMTQCKCNIIANSSFSWWGAWLNNHKDKIVIAPSTWINGRKTPDIWCEDWIRI